MMRRIFILIILVLSVSGGSLSAERPLKIVSLAPSTTEILFELGLADNIIGVTTFCNYPPEAQTKDQVGTFSNPDIERIVYLAPDMVFATGLEQAPVVEKLKRFNMKVIVSDPSTFRELFSSIRQMGELTDRKKEADLLVRQMTSRIRRVRRKAEKIPVDVKPKVFIEIWHDPLMSAGKGSFVDELITAAGGRNIASDTPRPYSYFSAEQVIKRDPDCIILGYMNKNTPIDTFRERLGWGDISAVKNGCVYNDIDSDLFMRPGPRLVEALEKIHNRIYQYE